MITVVFPSPIVTSRSVLLAGSAVTGCSRVSSAMAEGSVAAPFTRVTRVGDSRPSLIQETSRVLVECYGGSEEATETLARLSKAVLMSCQQQFVGGVWVFRVEQTVGITDFYDAARGANRFQFEVALTLRGEEIT